MVIELLGGPLNGVIHEVWGNLQPSRIALPDEGELHWYDVLADGTAIYDRSEAMS